MAESKSSPYAECKDYVAVAQLVEPVPIPAHRSHDPANNQKRTDPFQFGSRFLEEGDDVFEFNAWDHVEADPEYYEYAELQYARQRASPVSDFDRQRFNSQPAKWWNLFYKNNTGNFFKNRKWLKQEFPILSEVTAADAGPKVVLEVGAGAGNTAFPVLMNNENEKLMVHACDYSKAAVDVMRKSENYNEKYMRADVWDVTATGLEKESVDVVVMVFIFSALAPNEWERAVSNIYQVLKPGGYVLFRDYGKGDLAQVRFKKGRWMGENFYVRGDGTRVYFFEKEEVSHIWGKWTPQGGIPEFKKEDENPSSDDHTSPDSGFEILNMDLDRRLIVNRQRKLKMHRCWLQGRFRKRMPSHSSDEVPPALERTTELRN
ncbi:actin filament binding protein [Microsporum canis CBS 113480]|uniref:tRNA N(3)-methylcytidine methyltransferase n=1 Tax=Arthroderma otae (strain ATCC MYA-4605 / CBS 113480) TaxID=554155 RepID=C5FJ00_ARTOC|nr:actin filament binding protein [Microsporum canis CBS 113480]EEQ29330.1 actin filament binding protein [Microsporum canis CBS 113480]